MTTGRRPTFDPDELDDTADESDGPRLRPVTAEISERVERDRDFFDRGKDDPLAPQNVDAGASEHERRLLAYVERTVRAAESEAAMARDEAQAAKVEASLARGEANKMAGRWAWLIAVASLLSALIAPVTIYSVKKLLASERASGAASELDRQRLADHAQVQANTSAIAELRGALWTLNPAGVLRLQGAARGPAPNDPVTP